MSSSSSSSPRSSRGPLTSHVLNTASGRPAAGMNVLLSRRNADQSWSSLAQRQTNSDGRCDRFLSDGELTPGIYRLHFDTNSYFTSHNVSTFYPFVEVVFEVVELGRHHHVPLILSPCGYSTYRGS